MKKLFTISDVKQVSFPVFNDKESFLVVYENEKYFTVPRLFIVKTSKPTRRGFHAHQSCTQILVALQGECQVMLKDGKEKKEILLNKPSEGLFIPPSIWAEQCYQSDTTLLVLTDMPYDESDYLRDYHDFLNFRKTT